MEPLPEKFAARATLASPALVAVTKPATLMVMVPVAPNHVEGPLLCAAEPPYRYPTLRVEAVELRWVR